MADAPVELEWLSDYVVHILKAPTWVTPIAQFVDERCAIFEDCEENKLEYTTVFNQFRDLMDSLLTAHLVDVSVTPEQFSAFCQQGLASQALHRVLVEQLLSAEDFLTFKAMMVKRNALLYTETIRELERLQNAEAPLGVERLGENPTVQICDDEYSPRGAEKVIAEEWRLYEDQLLKVLKMSEDESQWEASARCEEAELAEAIALSIAAEEERLRQMSAADPAAVAAAAASMEAGGFAPPEWYRPAAAPPNYGHRPAGPSEPQYPDPFTVGPQRMSASLAASMTHGQMAYMSAEQATPLPGDPYAGQPGVMPVVDAQGRPIYMTAPLQPRFAALPSMVRVDPTPLPGGGSSYPAPAPAAVDAQGRPIYMSQPLQAAPIGGFPQPLPEPYFQPVPMPAPYAQTAPWPEQQQQQQQVPAPAPLPAPILAPNPAAAPFLEPIPGAPQGHALPAPSRDAMLQVSADMERRRCQTILARERADRALAAPATSGGAPRAPAPAAAPAAQPLTIADIAARQEHLRQQRAMIIEKRNREREAQLDAYQRERQQGARPAPPASSTARRTADLAAGRVTAEGAQLQRELSGQAPAEPLAGNQAAASAMRQALTQQLRRTLTRQMSSNADDLTTQLEQVKFR